jgi:hypothetical protein
VGKHGREVPAVPAGDPEIDGSVSLGDDITVDTTVSYGYVASDGSLESLNKTITDYAQQSDLSAEDVGEELGDGLVVQVDESVTASIASGDIGDHKWAVSTSIDSRG